MNNKLEKKFYILGKHYDELFKRFGNDVKTSQQSNSKTRLIRYEQLLKNINLKPTDSVLDFGCGTGSFFYFLKKKNFKGNYTGYDISSKIIKNNKLKFKKNKKVSFEKKNILLKKIKKKFDYIFINGTFNNNIGCNWLWMRKTLKLLFSNTKKALIFNNLTNYVEYKDNLLFYIEPEKIFKYCKKNLSNLIVLNHGYKIKKKIIPYEFTTYIFKD